MSLHVDGDEFWHALAPDIAGARDHVYVQTLCFEGDRAGLALAEALLASPAGDKRVVIDSVTRYMVNDQFVYAPAAQLDVGLRREEWRTRSMVRRLRRGGVGVKFVWPIRGLLYRLPVRNHKKLVAIDDRIAYVGGINICEHNFAWHDLMLRIEGGRAARFLCEDFLRTWRGRDECSAARLDGLELLIAAGRDHGFLLAPVAELIDKARHRIYLQCPYITSPFFELLGNARRRGVEVAVVTSEIHNRGPMRWGILEACRRHNLTVRFYQGRMTHLKAMLVDDDALVLGSANFDFLSYGLQPEIVCVVRRPAVIAEFVRRVERRDVTRSRACTPAEMDGARGSLVLAGFRLIERVLQVTSRF